MQKTRSHLMTGLNARTITVASNFKFEKVDKLNQIVQELEQKQRERTDGYGESGEERVGMSEKVLQVLKKKIKNNYEQLYSNYPDNKEKILKQIQTVQTNISGENVMKQKQEEIIKERAKFNKLKTVVDDKQRKLKKLYDMRKQLSLQANPEPEDKNQISKCQQLENKKREGEYNNVVAEEMLNQRKNVLLTLQKRYHNLTCELKDKKDKSEKWRLANIKRREVILRLQQTLSRAQTVEIPSKMAEELSSKIEEYQNKHSYSNIIHHESILEDQRFQDIKKENERKREEQRILRLKKEKEEKKQFQKLRQETLNNNMEQFKIMRSYGVESIQDILENDSHRSENLEEVNQQIEEEILTLQSQNIQLQKDIQDFMSKEQKDKGKHKEELEEELREEQKSRNKNYRELANKSKLRNEWKILLHLMNCSQINEKNLGQVIETVTNPQTVRLIGQQVQNKKHHLAINQAQTEILDFQ